MLSMVTAQGSHVRDGHGKPQMELFCRLVHCPSLGAASTTTKGSNEIHANSNSKLEGCRLKRLHQSSTQYEKNPS